MSLNILPIETLQNIILFSDINPFEIRTINRNIYNACKISYKTYYRSLPYINEFVYTYERTYNDCGQYKLKIGKIVSGRHVVTIEPVDYELIRSDIEFDRSIGCYIFYSLSSFKRNIVATYFKDEKDIEDNGACFIQEYYYKNQTKTKLWTILNLDLPIFGYIKKKSFLIEI